MTVKKGVKGFGVHKVGGTGLSLKEGDFRGIFYLFFIFIFLIFF